MNELTCVTELPSHIPSNKRRREEESSHPSNVVDTPDLGFSVPVEPAMSRPIAGTQRISQLEAEAPSQRSGPSHPNHHPQSHNSLLQTKFTSDIAHEVIVGYYITLGKRVLDVFSMHLNYFSKEFSTAFNSLFFVAR